MLLPGVRLPWRPLQIYVNWCAKVEQAFLAKPGRSASIPFKTNYPKYWKTSEFTTCLRNSWSTPQKLSISKGFRFSPKPYTYIQNFKTPQKLRKPLNRQAKAKLHAGTRSKSAVTILLNLSQDTVHVWAQLEEHRPHLREDHPFGHIAVVAAAREPAPCDIGSMILRYTYYLKWFCV